MNEHSVFVLSKDGKPLTPTTPGRARKLVKGGVAKGIWSKFNTWGIQMLIPVGSKGPVVSMGIDNGTKFEGYSIVSGTENQLNIKLDLPDKDNIVRKMENRRALRRSRRFRNCRRRLIRRNNRTKQDFIAPSQFVVVNSRLKIMKELFRLFPVTKAGFEDVRFNHAKNRWGANFSTMEIGKKRLKNFIRIQGAEITDFRGNETQAIRKGFGYIKTKIKNADKFTAHCSDSLSLAIAVNGNERIEPGLFLTVDDTYRPVRRRLHDSQPAKGGVRDKYSKGTVFGLRKGLLVMSNNGKQGRLTGSKHKSYRYIDQGGKRQNTVKLLWISSHFIIKSKKEWDKKA